MPLLLLWVEWSAEAEGCDDVYEPEEGARELTLLLLSTLVYCERRGGQRPITFSHRVSANDLATFFLLFLWGIIISGINCDLNLFIQRKSLDELLELFDCMLAHRISHHTEGICHHAGER